MQKIFFPLIFICFLGYAFPQSVIETQNFLFPQGFIYSPINAVGVSNPVYNSGNGNPASLADYSRSALGVSFRFASDINPAWIYEIKYKQYKSYIPATAGLVLIKSPWRIGLGYSQIYNSVMDNGWIPVTTVFEPNGTGEYYHSFEINMIYKYFLALSYTESFAGFSWDIGVRINLDNLYNENHIFNDKIESSAEDISASIGLRLGKEVGVLKLLSDIYFERNPVFNARLSFPDNPLAGDSVEIIFLPVMPEIKETTEIPDVLHYGFRIEYKRIAGIMYGVQKEYWSELQDFDSDCVNYSYNIFIRPVRTVTTTMGLYSATRKYLKRQDSPISKLNRQKSKALFFLGGITLHLRNMDLEFSAISSKNKWSGEWGRQMIVETGFFYRL